MKAFENNGDLALSYVIGEQFFPLLMRAKTDRQAASQVPQFALEIHSLAHMGAFRDFFKSRQAFYWAARATNPDMGPGHRTRAAQLLAGLAKSDPKQRMLKDFDAVMAVTRDEKFVTARHALQAAWKVGLAGKKHQVPVVDRMGKRFEECAAEKNCSLIRYDIEVGLRKLYDAAGDENIRKTALALIETEPDLKYRKKYARVWKRP
jgi:hypothetical protein